MISGWIADQWLNNESKDFPVCEPSTLVMFGLGGISLAFGTIRLRFRKAT